MTKMLQMHFVKISLSEKFKKLFIGIRIQSA